MFLVAGIYVCESEGRKEMESYDFGSVTVCGLLLVCRV
jgi:hypothetical protein